MTETTDLVERATREYEDRKSAAVHYDKDVTELWGEVISEISRLRLALAQAEAGNKGLSAALKRLLVKYVNCARAHGNDDETINDSARFATDALSASPRDDLIIEQQTRLAQVEAGNRNTKDAQ